MKKKRAVLLLAWGCSAGLAVQNLGLPILAAIQQEDYLEFATPNGTVVFEVEKDHASGQNEQTNKAYLKSVQMSGTDELVFAVPEAIDSGNIPVVGILAGAFANLPVEKIIVPAFVEWIEDGAFENCQNLQEMVFENPDLYSDSMLQNCPYAKVTDAAGNVAAEAEKTLRDNDEEQSGTIDVFGVEDTALVEEMPIGAGSLTTGGLVSSGKWVKTGSNWKFEINGTALRNAWRLVDGLTYYFQEDGTMVRGWNKVEDLWYFFLNDGRLVRNRWVGDDYVGSDGRWIPNDWGTHNGKTCFILGDGKLVTNTWKKKDGCWYWLDGSGYVYNQGFKTIEGKEYFFESSGVMAANKWISTNGNYKYMDASGACVKNDFAWVDGVRYHLNDLGYPDTGFFNVNGALYYAKGNGAMLSDCFLRQNGSVYYVGSNGQIPTVVFRVNNMRFYPGENGTLSSVVVNGKTSYAGSGFQWSDAFGDASVIPAKTMTDMLARKLGTPTVGRPLTKTIDGTSYQLLLLPHHYLKITQGENGRFSHQGSYALDMAGRDFGIDQVYAPCDMHLVQTLPYEKGNAMFWHSDNPVLFADGTIDYASILLLHDDYIGDVKKSVKQGEEFADEGQAGYATGNHNHFEIAKGKVDPTYFKNMFKVRQLRNSVAVDQACVSDGTTLEAGGQPIDGDGWKMEWRTANDVVKSGIHQKPSKAKEEFGKFWIKEEVKVRWVPGFEGKEAGYSLEMGQSVVFDCTIERDGHLWLGFIDKKGNRKWISSGEYDGRTWKTSYGEIEKGEESQYIQSGSELS